MSLLVSSCGNESSYENESLTDEKKREQSERYKKEVIEDYDPDFPLREHLLVGEEADPLVEGKVKDLDEIKKSCVHEYINKYFHNSYARCLIEGYDEMVGGGCDHLSRGFIGAHAYEMAFKECGVE